MSKRHVKLLIAAGVVSSLCCGVVQAKQILNTGYIGGTGQNPAACADIEIAVQGAPTAAGDPVSNAWCAVEVYWAPAGAGWAVAQNNFYHCHPLQCTDYQWCPQDGTTINSYVTTCGGGGGPDFCVGGEGNPTVRPTPGCINLNNASPVTRALTIPLPKEPGVIGAANGIELWVKLVAEQDCKGTEGPDGICSQTHDSAPAVVTGQAVFNQGNQAWEFDANVQTNQFVSGLDSDGDGMADACDACPFNPTKNRVVGCCGCGSNACDGTNMSDPNSECDYDGDGVPNCADECFMNPGRVCEGECGCGYEGNLNCGPSYCGWCFLDNCGPGGDGDGDGWAPGMGDCMDHGGPSPRCANGGGPFFCVDDPSCDEPEGPFCTEESPFKQDIECAQRGDLGSVIGEYCSDLANCYDGDIDGDCILDCHDHCPLDSEKTVPGICGCNWADVDTDGDGTYDCPCVDIETCVTDADCLGGTCMDCGEGGGFMATCSAGDRVCVIENTCGDYCPTDANKLVPGICGCETPDVDSDGDGAYDCNEDCPLDPNKTEPGACGCGVADTSDGDGDGTPDCIDLCPDDINKIAPGQCGCGNPEAPVGGYDGLGGIVHIPLRTAADFFDGVPYVEVILSCQNSSPNQQTDTCAVDGQTGFFSFDGVPCGTCSLSFYYKDECEDLFKVKICGDEAVVGNGEWVTFEVTEDQGTMAPCLGSIDVTATNNSYDILMSNQACEDDPSKLCFDHVGRPSMSLGTSLIRLAGCFFNGQCCGPADAQALLPVTSCKCRYDCNDDQIFSVVSDLACWTDCLVNGNCHPDTCGDTPFPPGVGGAANTASVVGGIIFDDADNPLVSGVQGVRVDVITPNGTVINSETNRIGVWVVEGLENGTYTVEFDGGKGSTSIDVNNDNIEKNQSIEWHKKTNARRLDVRGRAAVN